MLPQHQSSVRCLKMGGSCQVCVRIRLFRVGTGWHAGSLKYGRRCHSSSGRRGKRKTTATVFHNAMCCQWSMCSSILWSLLPDGGEFSTAHENIEYVTASLEQLSKIFWRIAGGGLIEALVSIWVGHESRGFIPTRNWLCLKETLFRLRRKEQMKGNIGFEIKHCLHISI